MGRSRTSLTKDVGAWVTSMATTWATSFGLDHFGGVLGTASRAELSVYRTGCDDRYAHVVLAQFFRDGVGQAVESPLGGGMSGYLRKEILSRRATKC